MSLTRSTKFQEKPTEMAETIRLESSNESFVSYDQSLLEQARNQWQLGDWQSLAGIEFVSLQHHPDRVKIILLVAAGCLQIGDNNKARAFIRKAQEWGGGRRMVSQILVASIHNALGRARMAEGQNQLALSHFESEIGIVTPEADQKLLGETRAIRVATLQGLLPQAARLISSQLVGAKQTTNPDSSRIKILETEIEMLHHELSLAQQRQQLFNERSNPASSKDLNDEQSWIKELKNKSVSQLGQDLWVLQKTEYKRGGFFVEFGATDGVLLSNTWLLEKEFGWQGICAEPNPKFFEQLKRNRQCKTTNEFIGRESGKEIDFILADVYGASLEHAYSDMHADKREAYFSEGQVTKLISVSLDDFLRAYHAPYDIDFISIDTEGSEYDLLSTFPFEKWNIRLITVEHNYSPQREQILQLLTSYGYRRYENQWDDWYEKVTT